MKRLLILGASGHIGGYLFRQFREDGYTVFGTSKTPERCSAQQGMLFYSLEKGEEALQSVLDTAKPEVVISCERILRSSWRRTDSLRTICGSVRGQSLSTCRRQTSLTP